MTSQNDFALRPGPGRRRRWTGRRMPLRGLGLRQRVRDDGVGVPVPHSVLGLEQADQLHVLGVGLRRHGRAHDILPLPDRLAVLLLDQREVRSGTLLSAVELYLLLFAIDATVPP